MPSVLEAEKEILNQNISKTYKPIDGDKEFIEESIKLIAGEAIFPKIKNTSFGLNTPGGTGALRLSSDFLFQFSPKSKVAFQYALELQNKYEAVLFVLNVNEDFLSKDEMIMSRVSVEALQKTFRDISIKAKKEIRHLIEDLDGGDIDIEIKIRDGKSASDEIIAFSNKINPDLIVMGTNGRDSVSDVILGSTAEQVIKNIKCPTLIVPIGG